MEIKQPAQLLADLKVDAPHRTKKLLQEVLLEFGRRNFHRNGTFGF